MTGLASWAETPDIRISAPSLGWVLASDGSQVIEISGITESPRAGRAIGLAAASRAWASPDASAVLLRTASGLSLLRANETVETLAELPPGVAVSAAWDRTSAGFAVCWETNCETRGANGAVRSRLDVASGTRLLAFSATAGILTADSESATWRNDTGSTRLDAIPASAAFRPGTQELWLIDSAGRLAGQDFQGRPAGSADLIPDPAGLVASLDGKSFFAANASGDAAQTNLDTLQTERFFLDDTVEGLWPAPGRFTVRLHDSAKRAIAIWNGDTGVTGWVPALNNEVRQ